MTNGTAITSLHSLEIQRSPFAFVPDLCQSSGYQFVDLQYGSAVIKAEGYVFTLSQCTLLVHSGVRFGHGTPEAVKRLVMLRNRQLQRSGWLAGKGLSLFMPIIGDQFARDYLAEAIREMTAEINLFSRHLRADGVRNS